MPCTEDAIASRRVGRPERWSPIEEIEAVATSDATPRLDMTFG